VTFMTHVMILIFGCTGNVRGRFGRSGRSRGLSAKTHENLKSFREEKRGSELVMSGSSGVNSGEKALTVPNTDADLAWDGRARNS
jgi:hypothetical protein